MDCSSTRLSITQSLLASLRTSRSQLVSTSSCMHVLPHVMLYAGDSLDEGTFFAPGAWNITYSSSLILSGPPSCPQGPTLTRFWDPSTDDEVLDFSYQRRSSTDPRALPQRPRAGVSIPHGRREPARADVQAHGRVEGRLPLPVYPADSPRAALGRAACMDVQCVDVFPISAIIVS